MSKKRRSTCFRAACLDSKELQASPRILVCYIIRLCFLSWLCGILTSLLVPSVEAHAESSGDDDDDSEESEEE